MWDGAADLRKKKEGARAIIELGESFETAALAGPLSGIAAQLGADAQSLPLFLVDLPWRESVEQVSDLIVRTRSLGTEEGQETSGLLRLLYDSQFFNREVSRLRVYCHPRVRERLQPYKHELRVLFGSVVTSRLNETGAGDANTG